MSTLRLLLPIMLFVLVACTPGRAKPESSAAATVSDSAQVGTFVPVGQLTWQELERRFETVTNCGTAELLITKHVSMSTTTTHGFRWEVNGHVGTGLTVGKGVVPGGVDLEAAFGFTSGINFQEGVEHSTAWDLPAPHGTVIDFTLAWFEGWQPGYIDVTLADKSITRIDVEYRGGTYSNIVEQHAYDCFGNQIPVEVTPIQSQPLPILDISWQLAPTPAPGTTSPPLPPAAQPGGTWPEPGPSVPPFDPAADAPDAGSFLVPLVPPTTPIPSGLDSWIPPGPDRYRESKP